MLAAGTNPGALLNELRALGECQIEGNTEAVPTLDELQPDNCYLAWDITLTTRHGANAIKDVFIFVEDGSELEIVPVNPQAAKASASLDASQEDGSVAPAKAEPKASSPVSKSDPAVAFHGAATASSSRKPVAQESTVRVPSERLDRLVNLVGELVMNQSRLTQVAAHANAPNLSGPVEELERLVAELRDNVLGIRMMPIGTTFGRFKRLVHDLSRELGKEIDLITAGEETELDKTVLDQLADPLVHLIRNSLDHGIESPVEREKAGKPRRGVLRLSAAHEGAHVVITIQDDGRGLDAAEIMAKAIEKGLATPDAPAGRGGNLQSHLSSRFLDRP